MQVLPRMNQDGPMKASVWNSLVDYVRQLQILPSPEITATVTAAGTMLRVGSEPTTGISAWARPWDLIASPKTNSNGEIIPNQWTVSVAAGLVNNVLPSNWQETHDCTASIKYFWVDITTNGKSVVSATIATGNTIPPPTTPLLEAVPSSIKIVFGIFYKGSTYRPIPDGNIGVSPYVAFVASKSSPQPGESPYLHYWNLG